MATTVRTVARIPVLLAAGPDTGTILVHVKNTGNDDLWVGGPTVDTDGPEARGKIAPGSGGNIELTSTDWLHGFSAGRTTVEVTVPAGSR